MNHCERLDESADGASVDALTLFGAGYRRIGSRDGKRLIDGVSAAMTERDDWGFDSEPLAETRRALDAAAEPAPRDAERPDARARDESHTAVLLVAITLILLQLAWVGGLAALVWRVVSGVVG